jgi:PIN domain nuclease of toxin-antitoxin system
MKLLLDTHTFIWWDSDPARLSPRAMTLCEDPMNTILLSVASVWEMQIKRQLGKLKLTLSVADIIASQQEAHNIEVLPVNLSHVLALENLPEHHKDPFDRLLISQAVVEGAALVSRDKVFEQYTVAVEW